MSNRLNFSIAVNLLTDGVKKGATSFKNELQAMQFKTIAFASALGFGGLGLGNFSSKLIAAARDTNRASTALKNVSKDAVGFAENQKFLLGISKKYGVEVNSLSLGFAKFTAAASAANMPMLDQQKIFESLSRASTAFALNTDETKGVFLAVTQMMGKGKITAEELRGQLGERLPIAMQAMAKAAGVSVAGLDKIMKAGKLMSADVLPKFADAINEMLPNVNTDNLETSLGRLSNAFIAFTKGTGIQSAYKTVVDGITSIVSYGAENIKGIVRAAASVIVGIIGGKLITAVSAYFANATALFKSHAVTAQVAEAQVLLATSKRVKAQEILELANLNFSKAKGVDKLNAKKAVNSAQLAMDKAVAMEERAILNQTAAAEKATQAASLTRFGRVSATIGAAFKSVGSAIGSTLKAFAPMAIIMGVTAIVTTLIAWRKEQKRINDLYTDYKAQAKSAGKNTASGNELSNLKRIYDDINRPLAERKTALNSINTALGKNFEFNLKDKKLQQDINKEYQKRLALIEARAKYEFYTDRVLKATASNDDLNQKNVGRVENSKQNVKDLIYSKFGNNEQSQKYIGQISNILETGKGSVSNDFMSKFDVKKVNADGREYVSNALDAIMNANQRAWEGFNTSAEVKANNAIIVNATDSKNKIKTEFGALVGDEGSTYTNLGDGGSETTDLAKAEKNYTEKVNQLTNQLANKALTEAEYNKSLDELNKETVKTIGGLINPKDAATNQVFQKASAGVKGPLYTKADEATEKFTEEQTKYNLQLKALTKRKDLALISDEDYSKSLNNLIDSTIDNALSIDGIGNAADLFVKKLNAAKIPELKKFDSPDLSKNDTFFDYKKTDSEKMQGRVETNLDNIDKISSAFEKMGIEDIQRKIIDTGGNLDKLRSQFDSEAQGMLDALTKLMKETPDMSKAMKILEVRDEIKDLQKQLAEGLYSNLLNIGSTARSIRDAFQQLNDVMADPESDGWDKFFSMWESFATILDGIVSTVTAITSLVDIINELKAAKEAATPAEIAHATAVVAANTMIATSDTAKTGVVAVNSGVQVVANKAASASFSELMAAETAAAYASIPFAGAGLALAQIGTLQAAIIAAGIPKFANGGIVGGSSYIGDKLLIAANSGELVLNQDQQATVFGQMNKGQVLSADVRLRGSDIFMSLSNHMKKTGMRLP